MIEYATLAFDVLTTGYLLVAILLVILAILITLVIALLRKDPSMAPPPTCDCDQEDPRD